MGTIEKKVEEIEKENSSMHESEKSNQNGDQKNEANSTDFETEKSRLKISMPSENGPFVTLTEFTHHQVK